MTEARNAIAQRFSARALLDRVASWRADGSDRSVAQRVAGTAFAIRVASAVVVFLTQVLLARWMGRHEFGIYVYVWTWVGFLGALVPLGMAYSAAPRFIPQYRTCGDHARLRGFLFGSRWMCFALGTAAAGVFAGVIIALGGRIGPHYYVAFLIACAAIPIFTVSCVNDSIARSFNWIDLALIPFFLIQPLIILAAMATLHLAGVPILAIYVLATACGGLWLVTLIQLFLVQHRLSQHVEKGPRQYDMGGWIRTVLPIFLVDGFFVLLTHVDVLILQLFVGPADIAVYYASIKTLILVNFIYFAVQAAAAHRFSEYHAAGDREKLSAFVADTVRWTFWPSLTLAVILLALGKPVLALFGPGFDQGYPLMFILVIGLLARAAVGPAERLLNMVGEQRVCAVVYAAAFFANITLCLLLIPHFGLTGAAISTASAVILESVLLFMVTKRRLGVHVFVFFRSRGG
ncbi:MAG: lipopolysaccharide biosynthesis protein [Proteobacteria bacterium]|nr:lipopolysaccharide biosynthesis protein [Pseudomonadota bacterium]